MLVLIVGQSLRYFQAHVSKRLKRKQICDQNRTGTYQFEHLEFFLLQQ